MYSRMVIFLICAVFTYGCTLYPGGEIRSHKRMIDSLEDQIHGQQSEIDSIWAELEELSTELDQLRDESARRFMSIWSEVESLQTSVESQRTDPVSEYINLGVNLDREPAQAPPVMQPMAEIQDRTEKTQEVPQPQRSQAQLGESELYRSALDLYFAERPESARLEFRDFLDRFPESALVPNAWYWLAETYYLQNDYPRAILMFRRVLDKFPEDPKAPDSLFKIGLSYQRLGDARNALFYLGILTQDYPESESARRAGPLKEQLRRET